MGIKRVTHQQNLKIKAKVSKHDLQILNKIWRKDNVDSTVEMKGYVCLHSRQTCAEGHKNSHCGNHALEIESHWTASGGRRICYQSTCSAWPESQNEPSPPAPVPHVAQPQAEPK